MALLLQLSPEWIGSPRGRRRRMAERRRCAAPVAGNHGYMLCRPGGGSRRVRDILPGVGGTLRLALSHHLLAVGVEGVVDDPLGLVQFVVVLEIQVPEAFRDSRNA